MKRESQRLIERVTSQNELPIKLKIVDSNDSYFSHKVKKGVLTIEGDNGVSLIRGFYDYVKNNKYGLYSWSGGNIKLPKELKTSSPHEVISPVKHHYMSNVVVYGYTKPYWDWERWEQEIDWLALHGIDMPLAMVGYEAILLRTLKEFGLTEQEINSYFVGPAHLPWMRMGNMSVTTGPLNNNWHDSQIALQHKILERMRGLGMKPIVPGFAGFVPEAIKRVYPDIDIIKTSWAGAFSNWMISPDSDLFMKIGTAFIKEWEREFGKCDYYLVDSFNEMEIPFPPKESNERYTLLASYGDRVYKSIKAANKDAIWVMQGWMFGYQRNIWDYKTLEALVSEVPDNKMLLLDLAVDYNKHFWKSEVNWEYYKGFFNKQWAYSVIPNMGGKTAMTGVLDFYANGHLEALQSPNRGELVAIGMAPEGLENNEVIYELFSDASWSSSEINLDEWLINYSINRYGACPKEIENYWLLLRKSVYGSFTDHPRFNWQLRPGRASKGTVNFNDNYFKAIEQFIAAAPVLKNSPLYMADFREVAAMYLSAKIELLTAKIEKSYTDNDFQTAQQQERLFAELMLSVDAILEGHPNLRLSKWLEYAAKSATNEQEREHYVSNAKRLVTIWGPPIDDYSARLWSGLIRDYYLPRWLNYFASKNSGKPFDFAKWERNWVESTNKLSSTTTVDDIIEFVNKIINSPLVRAI